MAPRACAVSRYATLSLRRHRVAPIVAAFAASVLVAPAAFASPDSAAAAAIIAGCARTASELDCTSQRLFEIVDRDGAARAMTTLDRLLATRPSLRPDAHGLAHRIGIRAFRSPATLAADFASCPPTNLSGCYHGVMQGYFLALKESRTPLTTELLDAACAPHASAGNNLLFQCIHGLGHGLMALHDNHLPSALRSCDLLSGDAQRVDCHTGAFMEGIVLYTHPHHAATGAAHHHGAQHWDLLRPSDRQYPCSAVDDKYRSACYTMQSSAMLHLNRGDVAATAADCRRAPRAHVTRCLESLGRDVFALAGGDFARLARFCAGLDSVAAPACVAGASGTVVNVRGSVEDGLSFCSSVPRAAGRRACYAAVGRASVALVGDPLRRVQLCATVDEEFRSDCAVAAQVPARVGAPRATSGSEQ